MTLRSLLAGLAAAASGLLLTGCSVTGTVDLSAGTTVSADLMVSGTSSELDCQYLTFGGLSSVQTSDGAKRTCHLSGDVVTENLLASTGVITVASAGPLQVLVVNLGGFASTTVDLDVDVVMPGRVQATSAGVASGDRVKLTGPLPSVLIIESTSAPDALTWELGAAVSVALLAFGLGWVLRGRRTPKPDGNTSVDEADEEYGVDRPAAPPVPGLAGWGPPVGEPVSGPPPPPVVADEPDRSAWAPPEGWRA